MKFREISKKLAAMLVLSVLIGTAGSPVMSAYAGSSETPAEYAAKQEAAGVKPVTETQGTASSEVGTVDEAADVKAAVIGPNVAYDVHCESYGWMKTARNGAFAGTQGETCRMEAIKIKLEDLKDPNGKPITGGIRYQVHVQSYGWLDEAQNGLMTGTEGQAKEMEAIKIYLYGDMAKYYDVVYRVHCESYGTMDWVKNGEMAGTTGEYKEIEGIEIKLVEK